MFNTQQGLSKSTNIPVILPWTPL